MVQQRDTSTLADFREHATEHLDRLNASGGAELLTVDGETKGVVVSPLTYAEMLKKIETLETAYEVRRGLDDFAAGHSVDAREAILEMIENLKTCTGRDGR